MNKEAVPAGLDANSKNIQQDEAGAAMDGAEASVCSFKAAQLLPEIRIDTSRLDELLSGLQRRLSTLEMSFARVAESAAEAAHKVTYGEKGVGEGDLDGTGAVGTMVALDATE